MDRDALAQALTAARARIGPEAVGLPAGARRRVPGLRREEVAAMAGISVDYLVRLEQGRGPRPSDQVLGALARALQLTDDEREHLFRVAGSAAPLPGQIVSTVRASTLRLLERLTDLPAVVLDAKGDVLAWNAMAAALLGDISAWPPGQRNVAWQRFLGEGGRVSGEGAEHERASVEAVAALRMALGRYPDDRGLRALLTDLTEGSEEFARLWAEGRVAERRSDRKTVHHPELGAITLDCDSLHIPDVDQRLVVYSAPAGSPQAESLALLRVLGLTRLAVDDRTGTPSGVELERG